MRKLALVLLLLATASIASAQSLYKYENYTIGTGGQPIANALVYVCLGNVTPSNAIPPCSPTQIYSNVSGSQTQPNPISTSPIGNYTFYAQPGIYTVAIMYNGQLVYSDPAITLPCVPGATCTFANTITTGGNNAFTGNNSHAGPETFTNKIIAGNINNIRYVDGVQYVTLFAALASCGSNPCWVIDTLPETFSSNPIAGYTGTAGCRIDFGSGLWTVNAQIIVPAKCSVNGTGRTDNTVFKAGTLPINTAMFRLGVGTGPDQESRIDNLSIDCNNVAGCQGVYSNSVSEQGGIFRTLIIHNLSHCVLIDMAGGSNFAQNFILNDLECFPTGTGTSVHGIYLRGSSSFAAVGPHYVSGISVVGLGASIYGDSVRAENLGFGDFFGIHGELSQNVFHVASTGGLGSSALNLSNITGTNTGAGQTNIVLIDSGSSDIDVRAAQRLNSSTYTTTVQDNSISPAISLTGASSFGQISATGHYHSGTDLFSNLSFYGLTNNFGLQMFNTTTTCTTAGSVGAVCTTAAITLPVAYADTNYRLSCTGQTPTNVPIVQTYTKSNTTFTITIAALTAAAATFTSYDCSAVHN